MKEQTVFLRFKIIKYSIIFIILTVFSCVGNKFKIEKNKFSYNWDEMPFHNYTDSMLINEFGKPKNDNIFLLIKDSTQELVPMYFPLLRFIPIDKNSINIREISWKQEDYIIIYWFLKSNNGWLSVDGVIYDPNHIEF